MQQRTANRITCSTNEVLYSLKWDHKLVKGVRVCTIPHHERESFLHKRSQKPDMFELLLFQVSCISIGNTVVQRGCHSGMIR